MKSRGGKSQRRKKKKKEYQGRERVRRQKIQMREKVGKSWFTVFFQWFVAQEGRKVGSLKRLVRAMWSDESFSKLHAVVARSTFPSQNVESTPGSDHFWKLWCRKSAYRCGAKHISKSKAWKTNGLGALLEVVMSKKCTPLWHEICFQVKMLKTPHARTTFEGSDVVLRGRRKGFCTLPKVRKAWGFCSISKNDGRRGTFAEDLQRWFRVACAVQETCSSEMLGGLGTDFLRGGFTLRPQDGPATLFKLLSY